MATEDTIEWLPILQVFRVRNEDGDSTSLPHLTRDLERALQNWERHLADHFQPDHSVITQGYWSSENDRLWFVDEARRLEGEFASLVPRSRGVVRVSPFPGLIRIRFFNDYSDWPLWDYEGGTSPESFPMLSDSLRSELLSWSCNQGDRSVRTQSDHDLVNRLQDELGPVFEIVPQ